MGYSKCFKVRVLCLLLTTASSQGGVGISTLVLGDPKENCKTELGKPEFNKIKQRTFDGFTVGMLAGVILDACAPREKRQFHHISDETLQGYINRNSNGKRKIKNIQTSYRLLATLCLWERDTMDLCLWERDTMEDLLTQIYRCDQGDIDWSLLLTRIKHDIPLFHQDDKSGFTRAPTVCEQACKENQILSALMSDETSITDLDTESQKTLKENLGDGHIFPTFLGLNINSWLRIESQGQNMRIINDIKYPDPITASFDKLKENKEFTVASLAEAIHYGEKYLDLSVNWRTIKTTKTTIERTPEENYECPICFEELSLDNLVLLDCKPCAEKIDHCSKCREPKKEMTI